MTILALIDEAIEHCKRCKPHETGHGVSIAYLKGIKEDVQSKDAEIERLTLKCSAIDSAILEFERIKRLAIDLKDVIYLDGVLAVLDSAKQGKLSKPPTE